MVQAVGDVIEPSIGAVADGRLFVAFTRVAPIAGTSVEVYVSDVNGSAFTPIGTFADTDPLHNYSRPDLVVLDGAGVVALSMLEQTPGGFNAVVATRPLGGGMWTVTTVTSGLQLSDPRIECRNPNVVSPVLHVLVRDVVVGLQPVNSTLYYVRSTDLGATWEPRQTVAVVAFPDHLGAFSFAAAADSPNLHLAYVAGPTEEGAIFYRRHSTDGDPGSAWTVPTALPGNAAAADQVELVANNLGSQLIVLYRTGGALHLAWSGNEGATFPFFDHVVAGAGEAPDAARAVAWLNFVQLGYRSGGGLLYRTVPFTQPNAVSSASSISDVGEPAIEPQIALRQGSGPALVWLRDDVTSATSYVDALWFSGTAAVDATPVETADRRLTASASPNPFAANVGIRVELAQEAPVDVRIYDVSGRLVTRFERRHLAVGTHVVAWDGTDQHGAAVPSGTYFAVATAGEAVARTRIARIR